MRNADQTALLIAILFQRSYQPYGRLGEPLVKQLSQRRTLRVSFYLEVKDKLDVDYGLCLTQLTTGGFGLVSFKTLEGAKSIVAKDVFSEDEIGMLANGDLTWAKEETDRYRAVLEEEIPHPGTSW